MNKDYMLRMKSNKANKVSSPTGGGGEAVGGWEVRPGGMLVQKRNSDFNHNANTVPNIKVRVKYGSIYHQIVISSQASFGATGVHTQDQKLIYKEKERDSKWFLDSAGVRDGSKIVLVEDEVSRERRRLESRNNAKLDKASKEIADIRFEVDTLAKQVATIELEINGGKKVVETVFLSLIELLMTQLIKLDAIAADGDVKLQRRMEVKRVQRYIETLDMLKMRNSNLEKVQQYQQIYKGSISKTFQKQQEMKKHGNFNPGQVVVTTKWETF
ncbi:BAG family molecular chaperone regulator 1-like isoform X2 [Salvia miltiorrhiza]|uniref:BAG family molecular chaperone regulator 1-like isoform X2 n=1 Tax=Salvia miltiorrhiza TaxID=226208 RepID=UPI0025AC7DF7|nr:BAG family molecular chaperone regulator 1-like isoform X2 [Salvia miltiorrhiza]XP_057763884.1 BAG family molecular chaperone regulator 1-like isoform X2 [Salvia miltiorrhiza]